MFAFSHVYNLNGLPPVMRHDPGGHTSVTIIDRIMSKRFGFGLSLLSPKVTDIIAEIGVSNIVASTCPCATAPS